MAYPVAAILKFFCYVFKLAVCAFSFTFCDKKIALVVIIKGRSKDAPVLWLAQKKYEERNEVPEVRADREMDIGV